MEVKHNKQNKNQYNYPSTRSIDRIDNYYNFHDSSVLILFFFNYSDGFPVRQKIRLINNNRIVEGMAKW